MFAVTQDDHLIAEEVGFDWAEELIAELTAEIAAMPEVSEVKNTTKPPTALPDDVMNVTTDGYVICPSTQAANISPPSKRRKTISLKAMNAESGHHGNCCGTQSGKSKISETFAFTTCVPTAPKFLTNFSQIWTHPNLKKKIEKPW